MLSIEIEMEVLTMFEIWSPQRWFLWSSHPISCTYSYVIEDILCTISKSYSEQINFLTKEGTDKQQQNVQVDNI